MNRTACTRSWNTTRRRAVSRPPLWLEALEPRLPPGDIIFAGLLAPAWLAPSPARWDDLGALLGSDPLPVREESGPAWSANLTLFLPPREDAVAERIESRGRAEYFRFMSGQAITDADLNGPFGHPVTAPGRGSTAPANDARPTGTGAAAASGPWTPASANGLAQTLGVASARVPATGLDLAILAGNILPGSGGGVLITQSRNFEVVGYNPLLQRGMNAAPAIYDHYLYVGNRTDGSPGHPYPGVLVLDIADPANPEVLGQIGPPDEGNIGETSRELRVWPEQRLLMVLNFACDPTIHACQSRTVTPTVKFYDLTDENAARPQLISTYLPSRTPHEMFLWVDPLRESRALLTLSAPTTSLVQPNLIVADISGARDGVFQEVAVGNWNDQFASAFRSRNDVRVHSMSVSPDGTRTYLAHLGGGFLVVDSSDLANDLPKPQLRLLTPVGEHPFWGNPGAHSAVKVFGRQLVMVTDEVYGTSQGSAHGCPWGWVRMIDIADEAQPQVIGEYKILQNTDAYCQSLEGQDPNNTRWTSYSSHNPTVLRDLALVSWHSGGLQAFSTANPARPLQTGFFSPEPLRFVATEDPALSRGINKVVMWSYPIIKDGLIYVVDIRNGLYVLRYTGAGSEEVAAISFLEGNSNLGDARRLEDG